MLDLEVRILGIMVDELGRGAGDLYGFALAKELADGRGSQRLTSHGTLYKALGRLEEAGLLASRWEAAGRAEAEGRPRRRLYRVTSEGRAALTAANEASRAPTWRVQPS